MKTATVTPWIGLDNKTRLNLSHDFKKYMLDADFRSHVDAFVANPGQQIRSDITELQIYKITIHDISLLAGLVNLQALNLANTQVQDFRPLAGLVNLRILYLAKYQVRESAILDFENTLPHRDVIYLDT